MSNCENPNQVAFHHISDVKRKHLQIYPPVIVPEPCYRRVFRNPIKTANNVSIKATTQPGLFAIVVFDFGSEFRIRIRVKFDPHAEKRFSIFRLVSRSGIPFTLPERRS